MRAIRLFLCGDMMTGLGIDQIGVSRATVGQAAMWSPHPQLHGGMLLP